MELHTLPSITTTGKKRGGLGHGSGRGKTAGRGYKGQNSRNKVPLRFEGGALSITKRMPFLRGKGKNKSFRGKFVILNVSALNIFPKDSIVDVALLVKHTLVLEKDVKANGIKILGNGELNVALTVKLPVSAGAQEKIEKAGGKLMKLHE